MGQRHRAGRSNGSAARPPLKLLRSESGLLLALDDGGHTATLSDGDGNNFLKISVDNGEIRVQCTAKVIVEAPQIELTDGAPHPLVFGDDLLQYLNQLVTTFNTHMHVGETVMGIPVTPIIPVTPFPPATPALLSTPRQNRISHDPQAHFVRGPQWPGTGLSWPVGRRALRAAGRALTCPISIQAPTPARMTAA